MRQRQLDIAVTAFVTIGEIQQEERNIALLQIAAPPELMGNIDGDVFRPVFGGVEGDDADRAVILTGQQILG
jgi:hypothetical protein